VAETYSCFPLVSFSGILVTYYSLHRDNTVSVYPSFAIKAN